VSWSKFSSCLGKNSWMAFQCKRILGQGIRIAVGLGNKRRRCLPCQQTKPGNIRHLNWRQ
jgi:hypothetical protein